MPDATIRINEEQRVLFETGNAKIGAAALINETGHHVGTPGNPLEVGGNTQEAILTELKKITFGLSILTQTDLDNI